MAQAGYAPFSSLTSPFQALRQPLRMLFERSTSPYRRTPHGKLYLGEGQPVIVFPVLGGGAGSTAELRRVLDEAGFVSYDWGLGVDTGPRDMSLNDWLRKLEEKVIDVFESTHSPVTLLGWSLSGIYAREVAKRTNPLVRQVITMGTPFNTDADPQRRCSIFKVLEEGQGGRMALNIRHRLRQCPPVPFTSLYSRGDGVVPWELCVEAETPLTENIEIPGVTHLRLPTHPRALEVITHRLAQPEGIWRPFEAATRSFLS
jgi:hypothetical protein